jgi:hypothetical protein
MFTKGRTAIEVIASSGEAVNGKNNARSKRTTTTTPPATTGHR